MTGEEASKVRILVTGGSGFLGGHLVERLVQDGHSVPVLVRRERDSPWLKQAEQFLGDIGDVAVVEQAAEGCDVVVHCAAVSGYQVKADDWSRVNVEGTRNVLNACLKANVRRLVYISTFLVTAKPGSQIIDEGMAYEPIGTSPYVDSKIAAEKIVGGAKGIETVMIRPGVIYGPRDRSGLPRITGPIKSGQFWFARGGRNPCHLVYVENVVDAIVAAMTREGARGAYFILDRPTVSVREFIDGLAMIMDVSRPGFSVPLLATRLANRVLQRLPRRWRPCNLAWRYGMQIFTSDLNYSTVRAERELGFRSGVDFQEAMSRLGAWMKAEKL